MLLGSKLLVPVWGQQSHSGKRAESDDEKAGQMWMTAAHSEPPRFRKKRITWYAGLKALSLTLNKFT